MGWIRTAWPPARITSMRRYPHSVINGVYACQAMFMALPFHPALSQTATQSSDQTFFVTLSDRHQSQPFPGMVPPCLSSKPPRITPGVSASPLMQRMSSKPLKKDRVTRTSSQLPMFAPSEHL